MEISNRSMITSLESYHVCRPTMRPGETANALEINNNLSLADPTYLKADPRLDKENDDGYGTSKLQKKRKSVNELEQEIVTLKRNLKQAQTTVDRTHAHMELQKSRTRQLISAWKQRLEDGEEQLQRHRGHLDNQMKAIATELFRFEGRLQNEQSEIQGRLDAKDRRIQQQQEAIETLVKANQNLTKALKSTRKKLKRYQRRQAERDARKERKREKKKAREEEARERHHRRSAKPDTVKAESAVEIQPQMRPRANTDSMRDTTDSIRRNADSMCGIYTFPDNNIMRSKSLPNFDLSVLEEEPEIFEESNICDSGSSVNEGRRNSDTSGATLSVSDIVDQGHSPLIRTKSDSLVRRMVKSEADLEKEELRRTSSLSLASKDDVRDTGHSIRKDSNSSFMSSGSGDVTVISAQRQTSIHSQYISHGEIRYLPQGSGSNQVEIIRARSLSALSMVPRQAGSQENLSESQKVRSYSHTNVPDSTVPDLDSNVPSVNTSQHTDQIVPSYDDDAFEITWSIASSPNMSDVKPATRRIQKPRDLKRRNKLRSQSDATCEKKPTIQTKRYHTSII